MYVNAIANQCLLGSWAENSRIDHVVSDTVEGITQKSRNPAHVLSSGCAMGVPPTLALQLLAD